MRGCIQKKGKKFYCVFRHDGKYIWRKGGDTKTEARAKLVEYLNELNQGTFKILKDARFDEYVKQWLSTKESARPKTYEFYSIMVAHLTHFFGDRKLKSIAYSDCKQFRDTSGGLSDNTINRSLGVLKQILSEAVRDNAIKENPAAYVKPLKTEKKEFPIPTTEELARFFEKVTNPKYRLLFEMTALLGLRRGEVTGLCWEDVNFDEATVAVRHSLQGGELAELKTPKARRTLPLPSYLVTELKKHKLAQPENEMGLVFASKNGQPIDGNNLRHRHFLPACKEAKVKFRIHDLRHLFISACVSLGQDLGSVSFRAGHSRISTSLDIYTHAIRGREHEYQEEVAQLLLKGTRASQKASGGLIDAGR